MSKFCRHYRLWVAAFLEQIGFLVGTLPKISITASLALAVCLCLGLSRVTVSEDLKKGFTPEDAHSHLELAALKSFMNTTEEMYYAPIFYRPKDASVTMMVNAEMLSDAQRIYDYLTKVVTVNVSGEMHNFDQYCTGCGVNQQLWILKVLRLAFV